MAIVSPPLTIADDKTQYRWYLGIRTGLPESDREKHEKLCLSRARHQDARHVCRNAGHGKVDERLKALPAQLGL